MAIRKRITDPPITLSNIANMGWSDGRAALHKLHPPAPTFEEKAATLVEEFNDIFDKFFDGSKRDCCRVRGFTYSHFESISNLVGALRDTVQEAQNEIQDLEDQLGDP